MNGIQCGFAACSGAIVVVRRLSDGETVGWLVGLSGSGMVCQTVSSGMINQKGRQWDSLSDSQTVSEMKFNTFSIKRSSNIASD